VPGYGQPGSYQPALWVSTEKRASRQCLISGRDADFPGVGIGKQNAVTLNHFVRLAKTFEIFASLIR
jgi:hypothetical protein